MITQPGITVEALHPATWQQLGEYRTTTGRWARLYKIPARLTLPCGAGTEFAYTVEVDESGNPTIVDSDGQRQRLQAAIAAAAGRPVGRSRGSCEIG